MHEDKEYEELFKWNTWLLSGGVEEIVKDLPSNETSYKNKDIPLVYKDMG